MIEHRPFANLVGGDHGWMKAKLHFVPSGDEARNRLFGDLLAWSDDEIAANSGFPKHPHRDAEIVTYVQKGAITHEDTLGNKGRAAAGEVQAISAGAGIEHAEFNGEAEPVRLFQIWFKPRTAGGKPGYSGKSFPQGKPEGEFITLASGDSKDSDALQINANARILNAILKAGETIVRDLPAGLRGYLVPTSGAITINGNRIEAHDGAAIHDEASISITAHDDTEIVLVELP